MPRKGHIFLLTQLLLNNTGLTICYYATNVQLAFGVHLWYGRARHNREIKISTV